MPVRINLLVKGSGSWWTRFFKRLVGLFSWRVKAPVLGPGLDSQFDTNGSKALRWTNETLLSAIRSEVNEIHLYSSVDGLTAYYRMGGNLEEVGSLAPEVGRAVLDRFHSMASIAPNLTSGTEVGWFKLRLGSDRDVAFRVEAQPALNGESLLVQLNSSSSRMLDG